MSCEVDGVLGRIHVVHGEQFPEHVLFFVVILIVVVVVFLFNFWWRIDVILDEVDGVVDHVPGEQAQEYVQYVAEGDAAQNTVGKRDEEKRAEGWHGKSNIGPIHTLHIIEEDNANGYKQWCSARRGNGSEYWVEKG